MKKLKKTTIHKTIYLDHAASTPIDPVVFAAMKPWLTTQFANPSALYASAIDARNAVEQSRDTVARLISTTPDTIYFTSGGTESANMAIRGVADDYFRTHNTRGHIITTAIEHHAVLHPIQELEKEGWEVTCLPVNSEGAVAVQDVVKHIRKDTVLVSVMYANNEIGTIEPIALLGKELLKWRKKNNTLYPFFHTDACQAALYLDLHVDRLHVDLMTLNGSKVYGPKGVGVLYRRRHIPLKPLTYGGGQEMGVRSGTENVPAIVGFAKALERAIRMQQKQIQRTLELQQYFLKTLQKHVPTCILNGPAITHSKKTRGVARETLQRLPNNIHITIPGVEAEVLILYLDAAGICCSSGSACTTDSDDISHVLLACGSDVEHARSALRFTFGRDITKKDIAYTVQQLTVIIHTLDRANKKILRTH